jgi:hypothetical protein
MYKQDVARAIIELQSKKSHPEWERHCKNLGRELLQRNPEEFMDFQAVRETMFVGNAEYTFDEFNELRENIAKVQLASEINDCDIFSQNFQHPLWSTTGNTIHHRYHLYMFEKWTETKIHSLSSIIELGGGYGNMARLCRRCGFSGDYSIIDLPEFQVLQKYYLTYQGCQANWEVDLTQEFDLFIATWSLSEIPLEDRFPYEQLKCRYFLMAFGPEYAGIDNSRYFSNLANIYTKHNFYLFKTPHLENQFYCIGAPV